jgi:hypothetical protein
MRDTEDTAMVDSVDRGPEDEDEAFEEVDGDEEEIEILPVVKWDFGTVSDEYIVFRPHVLEDPDQDEEEAEPTNWYALTPLQLRELAEQIVGLLRQSEGAGDEGEGDQRQ